MDSSGTPLSNSGPTKFSDADRLTGNSTVEPKSSKECSTKKNTVRKRITYSQEQLQELKTYFNQNQYLDPLQMEQIANRLGITHNQVKKWFQNMRMKRRKQGNGLTQEFQSARMHDLSVMNPSRSQGVVLQQDSWTNNTTHATKRDNQSWDYFSHLHSQQQKKDELPNVGYHQAPVVSTYFNPYLEPSTFQPNFGMNQSWNMSSKDNLQQQQNNGNYQDNLLSDQLKSTR